MGVSLRVQELSKENVMRNKLLFYFSYIKGVQIWIAVKLGFRVSSAMALPFVCFFLCLLFFLPNFHVSYGHPELDPPSIPSSPNTQPRPCPGTCGGIPILPPFFLNNTESPSSTYTSDHTCIGKYSIRCDHGSEEPMIKFADRELVVKDILYDVNFLILHDPALSGYLLHEQCGFLYNFTDHIQNFTIPPRSPSIVFLNSPIDCGKQIDAFSHAFFPTINNSHHCNDYNLYYWDEPLDQHKPAHSANCSVDNATFQWVLSFGTDDDSLSLLSAGFSRWYELEEEDCFYGQVAGKSCTTSSAATNSSCLRQKVCKPMGSETSRKSNKIIGIVAGVGGALILGCCIFFLYNRRKKQRQASLSNLLSRSTSSKISSKKDPELGDTNYHTHIFSYDELEEATNGFNESRELGDGGFGTVYKGKLRDGRTVAVKRLYENNYRRLEQFKNEVEILSSLRHQNLVTLYGCTSRHSRELLLVYEYIPNGTLADHLHGHLASNGALPWPVRMSIAIETADALAYLHAVEPQVIHRDVKTNNILLDGNFHVKVADFGLSRLFPLDATHVSTAPQGTPGYVDPEYHQCYQLTDKSDVYSFGVVLVELISSKPAVDISRHRHEINLSNMAITKIQNCQIDQLVDPELGYQSHPEIKGMINQVAELAFRCLQPDREMRPGIKEVLEVLKGLEGRGYKAEKEAEVAEVQVKEESRLLKNVSPFSPDSVTERWSSRSTTPNTST